MGEVAAHTALLAIGFRRGARRSRIAVAENDMIVNEVADRLHARDAERRVAKQPPRLARQQVALRKKRLGSKNSSVSDGRSRTSCCQAIRSPISKVPGSRITASVPKVKRPGGATNRLHQLPKLSR